ncbi:MAG: metal-dependent hydrolase [Chloroflexota bacterium]
MAQAGIHGLVGVAVRRWTPTRKLLLLGIVLGNLLPDADNLAVAVATVTGGSTEGLHRTFTHSLFFVLALVIVFWLVGVVGKRPSLTNLGLGLGIGVLMHILLDLLSGSMASRFCGQASLLGEFVGGVAAGLVCQVAAAAGDAFLCRLFLLAGGITRRQGTNLDRVKGVGCGRPFSSFSSSFSPCWCTRSTAVL